MASGSAVHVGGGWYNVKVGDKVVGRVKGKDAAERKLKRELKKASK